MKSTFVASLLLLATAQGLPFSSPASSSPHTSGLHHLQTTHLPNDFTCNEPFMIPAAYRDALGNRFALCFSDPRWNHKHLIWYVQELNGSFKAIGAAHKTRAGQYEGGVFPIEEPSHGSGIHAAPVSVRVTFDKSSGVIEMAPKSHDGIPVHWHIKPKGFKPGTLQVPSTCGPFLHEMKRPDNLAPLTGAEPGATACLLPQMKHSTKKARAFISWGRSRAKGHSTTKSNRNHALDLDGEWDRDDVGDGDRFFAVGFVGEDRGLAVDICERGEGSEAKRCEMSRLVGHTRKTFVLNDGRPRSTGVNGVSGNRREAHQGIRRRNHGPKNDHKGFKHHQVAKHSYHSHEHHKHPRHSHEHHKHPRHSLEHHKHPRHSLEHHKHLHHDQHDMKEIKRDINRLKHDLQSILEHAGRHEHDDFDNEELNDHRLGREHGLHCRVQKHGEDDHWHDYRQDRHARHHIRKEHRQDRHERHHIRKEHRQDRRDDRHELHFLKRHHHQREACPLGEHHPVARHRAFDACPMKGAHIHPRRQERLDSACPIERREHRRVHERVHLKEEACPIARKEACPVERREVDACPLEHRHKRHVHRHLHHYKRHEVREAHPIARKEACPIAREAHPRKEACPIAREAHPRREACNIHHAHPVARKEACPIASRKEACPIAPRKEACPIANKCKIYPLINEDEGRHADDKLIRLEDALTRLDRTVHRIEHELEQGKPVRRAGLVDDVGDAVDDGYNYVSSGISSAGIAIESGVSGLGNTLENGVGAVGNTVQGGFDTVGNTLQSGVSGVENTLQSGLKAVGVSSASNAFVKQFGKMIHDDFVEPQLERKRLGQYRAARNAAYQVGPAGPGPVGPGRLGTSVVNPVGPVGGADPRRLGPNPVLNPVGPVGGAPNLPLTADWSGLNPAPVVAASNAPLGPIGPVLAGNPVPSKARQDKQNYYKRQAADYLN